MIAGLVHHGSRFRNITYYPVTLQVRIIEIEGYTSKKPQDIWTSMDASFSRWLGYSLATSGFCWGLASVFGVLIVRSFELALYFLVLHYCFCLKKKKTLGIFARKSHGKRNSSILSTTILCALFRTRRLTVDKC